MFIVTVVNPAKINPPVIHSLLESQGTEGDGHLGHPPVLILLHLHIPFIVPRGVGTHRMPAYRSTAILDDGLALHTIGRGAEVVTRHAVVKRVDDEIESIIPAATEISAERFNHIIFLVFGMTYGSHIEEFVIVGDPYLCG